MNNEAAACVLLSPSVIRDKEQIDRLSKTSGVRILDSLDSQLEELFRIRHPETVRLGVDPNEKNAFCDEIYTSVGGKEMFGMWAWYPWNNLLMRVLPELLHTELRTARNRNLITAKEQDAFYSAHIGIAGLSVGNSVLGGILHTGGGKHLRLADPDTMAGSNTNRIRAGFDTIGLPKTVIAAREIYLTNPYASVEVFDGVSEENIDAFLTHPTKLNIVIDEMDELYLKIQLRIHARKLGIPVVMAADNGDGAVVDIERYDLDQNRPLMHGDIPEDELLSIPRNVPRATAAKIISAWVGHQNIAPRMMSSLMELGKTLYTWPQLGSAAALSGALLSYVVRAVITGQPIGQGKFVIRPEEIFDPSYNSDSSVRVRKSIQDAFTSGMKPDS